MKREKIVCSGAAEALVHGALHGLGHEEVWVILLGPTRTVRSVERIAVGDEDRVFLNRKAIMRRAIVKRAAFIILAHNHPSGSPMPSVNDMEATGSLRKACEVVGLSLLDHIIVGEDSYFSFADEKETPLNRERP